MDPSRGAASVAVLFLLLVSPGLQFGLGRASTVLSASPAPLQASGGSPSNWSSSASSYPLGVEFQSCVESSGYVYCVGGLGSSASTSSVYFAQEQSSGDLGAWRSTTSYPIPIRGTSCAVSSGHVYCVGGFARGAGGESVTSDVYYATISSGGVGSWTKTTSNPEVIAYSSCVATADTIFCIAGTGIGGNYPNLVTYAPIIAAGLDAWKYGTSYPDVAAAEYSSGVRCVESTGYVFCLGGGTGPGGDNGAGRSYFAPLTSSGVGPWTKGPDFPFSAYGEGCAAAGVNMVCAGGVATSSAYTATQAYSASISSTGIGAWNQFGSLSAYLLGPSCVGGTAAVYCIGGFDNNKKAPSTSVFYVSATGSFALTVYPTEPSIGTVTLSYQGSAPSSVHLQLDHTPPDGISVSFRPPGAKSFTQSADFAPSGGSTKVKVEVSVDCSLLLCNHPGSAVSLPARYDLTMTASGGSYSQTVTVSLQLQPAKWLVMQYSAADTVDPDLQDGMIGNIYEMLDATGVHDSPAVGMFVLVEVRTAQQLRLTAENVAPAQFENFPADTIRMYKIANGTMSQVGGDWSTKGMNDYYTLDQFVGYSISYVPAYHTQLIISDHGSGMRGVAYDYHHGGTPLEIGAVVSALEDHPKLDILSFDACFMAQMEVLYQLKAYADYFTASELTIPGPGYGYTQFITSLLQSPDQSTKDYLGSIVRAYADKYDGTETLAAIDSSGLDAISQDLHSLAGILRTHYASHDLTFNTTMAVVLEKVSYASSTRPYGDIRSLAQNLIGEFSGDHAITGAAASLLSDTTRAVVTNQSAFSSNRVEGTSGATTYEGITVLALQPGTPKDFSQAYLGSELDLAFDSDAVDHNKGSSWIYLMNDAYRAPGRALVESLFELILWDPPDHALTLQVYDSAGRHTGINPNLVSKSKDAVEAIPGSYYLNEGNGTTIITLPPNETSFKVMVDGSSMLSSSEGYTLRLENFKGGMVTSSQTVQGTIQQYTVLSTPATISNGTLSLGTTTTTTVTSSATSVLTTTTAGSTKGGGIPEFSFQLEAIAVFTAFVVASYLAARRLSSGPRPRTPEV